MKSVAGNITLEKIAKRLSRTDMHKSLLKIGVILLISGRSSYKFDENLLKLNENDKLGTVGQITNVTSESQRDALNARALTLLNSEFTMVSCQSCTNNLPQAARSWLQNRSLRQLILKLSSQRVTRVNSKAKVMSV